MNIEVTVKHDHDSQEVRDYAFEKAKKVLKYYQRITRVEVILKPEKDKHSAEMIISASRGTQLVGKTLHEDIHAAIDLLVDKMERQLVRFKERLKDRRTGRTDRVVPEEAPESDDEISYDDIIRRDYRGSE
ncbi:MAG: ribosome hibernation-promoting factor, HPF/YfiA family [Planctomycetota bacterium]